MSTIKHVLAFYRLSHHEWDSLDQIVQRTLYGQMQNNYIAREALQRIKRTDLETFDGEVSRYFEWQEGFINNALASMGCTV